MSIEEDSPQNPHAPAEQAAGSGVPPADGQVNPAALSAEQLARMLGVSEQKVREHVDAGAPTGPGGTINLVHYAAWLNRRLKELDGD